MPNRRPDWDRVNPWGDASPAEMLRRIDAAVAKGDAMPDEVEAQRAVYRRALEREGRENREEGRV